MGWSAWRHSVVLTAAGMLAVLATVGFAMLRPPTMLRSSTVVVVPAGNNIEAQARIARSEVVLGPASRSGPLSLEQLTHQVHVVVAPKVHMLIGGVHVFAHPRVLLIRAKATTAADAEGAVNAVARSYVAYMALPGRPGGPVRALWAPATEARGTSQAAWVAETTGFGTLVGFVLGVIAELALIWVPRQRTSLTSY